MYSQTVVIALNKIADEYRGKLESSIKTILSQARYTNTGRAVSSVKVDIVRGDGNKSPDLVVTLDDYVLLLDSSKLQWTRLPKVKELIAWAKTKRSNEREAEQLAWATAFDKKKNDTWKPKKWRKKAIGTVLTEMNAEMLKDFEKAIEEDWQQAIDKELKV